MGREKDLQAWFVEHAKKGTLASTIVNDDGNDGSRSGAQPPVTAGLDLADPPIVRAIANIDVVHDGLVEPVLCSCLVELADLAAAAADSENLDESEAAIVG